MSFDPIRFIAMPIIVPLGAWPSKVAGELQLGAATELLASPIFVLCVVATIETLARRLEGRWTGLGVLGPIRAAPSRAAADAIRVGRTFRPLRPYLSPIAAPHK